MSISKQWAERQEKTIAKEKVVNTLLGVSEIPASIIEVVNTRNMVMLQR